MGDHGDPPPAVGHLPHPVESLHAALATPVRPRRQPVVVQPDRAAADRVLLRCPGRAAHEGLAGRHDHRGHRAWRGPVVLPHAVDPGAGCGRLRLRLRPVADRLDHHRRGVPLQGLGQDRSVRHHPGFDPVGHRRPAPADADGRLRLRCLPGGRGRFRCAGGDHRGIAGRVGLQAAVCRRPVPDRQHRASGVRRDGHSDHRGRAGHRPGCIRDRPDGRSPAAVPDPHRAVLDHGDHGRLARHQGNLAGSAGGRWLVRHRAVPDLELHRPGAAGHHRFAGVAGLPDPVPAPLEAGTDLPLRYRNQRRGGRTGTGGAALQRRPDCQGVVAVPDPHRDGHAVEHQAVQVAVRGGRPAGKLGAEAPGARPRPEGAEDAADRGRAAQL